jgi:molybdate transport system substrate-binding protein
MGNNRLRMKTVLRSLFVFLLAVTLASGRAEAAEVMVFAAASLSDVLKEIASAYEKGGGDKIVFNFGASSALARQIDEGAPADIFFSADEAKMDDLEGKGLIRKETRKSRLSNSLVIVVAADSKLEISTARDLTRSDVKWLALAETRTVPAGIYAREYLQKQNLWSELEAKIIRTENVRAALSAVAAGNAQAGIVYKTDAGISKKVKIAYDIPLAEGPAISYPLAMLKDANHPISAELFLDHLNGSEASSVFQKYGFIIR